MRRQILSRLHSAAWRRDCRNERIPALHAAYFGVDKPPFAPLRHGYCKTAVCLAGSTVGKPVNQFIEVVKRRDVGHNGSLARHLDHDAVVQVALRHTRRVGNGSRKQHAL